MANETTTESDGRDEWDIIAVHTEEGAAFSIDLPDQTVLDDLPINRSAGERAVGQAHMQYPRPEKFDHYEVVGTLVTRDGEYVETQWGDI